jgi:hypothetical protein
VNATWDWRIRAEKPLLKALAPFMRPAGWRRIHRWAMKQGEEKPEAGNCSAAARRRRRYQERSAAARADHLCSRRPRCRCGVVAGGLGYLILRGRRRRRARRARSER